MHSPRYPPTRRDLARFLAAVGLFPRLQAGESNRAESHVRGGAFRLSNGLVQATWTAANQRFHADAVGFHPHMKPIRLAPDVFTLVLATGRTLRSSQLEIASMPRAEAVEPDPHSVRRAGQRSGRRLSVSFRDPESGAAVEWQAILLDSSRYLRQEIVITATIRDLPVTQIVLWDFDLEGAAVSGTVKGSPAVAGPVYLAFEHPLSTTMVARPRLRCSLERKLPVRAGNSFACSSVIGSTIDGLLRRGFLEYVEDQRAHPYRTFLHYNSWYDIGYFSKYDETAALDRIRFFGRELEERRGIVLDSFLFDDGWDDPASLWHFHSGFPRGFAAVSAAARDFQAAPGVWLSPWGGYGKPKQDRIRAGAEQGFEIQEGGFALSGPKYFDRFRDTCRAMIRDYSVNQFKFDGTGNANRVSPGSRFDSDFDAAISLIGDLREMKPDLYINLTTGTYPSPFWLRYADSIWRGGEDHEFAGTGSWRQRWITYRDASTYKHVVQAGPLFPINSLMLHGMIFASKAKNLGDDPHGDFTSEVHSYFATGTQLQEMYISPDLLSTQNWDDLAEAARWSRNNAATLVDTHWIGGDPANLDVYGWAAWSGSKGIITLRNPSDHARRFPLDVQSALELPVHSPRTFRAKSPWRSDAASAAVQLKAGKPHEFSLAPFEVITLELAPN
jgi:hypothetical protein